jgi:hypothetical protein
MPDLAVRHGPMTAADDLMLLEEEPTRYVHAPRHDHSMAGRLEYVLVRYWAWWLLLFYVVSGCFFVHAHVLIGDAVSRTATARMMIRGFDPHLAAVGFVWGPIPTFLQLPLVALYPIIPWFVTGGYVAIFISAPFAAWGAVQIHHMLAERGYSGPWTVLITAGIALNPLIIIFAGNGMTEMIYVAMLFASMRYLSRWELHKRTTDLALGGFWIGFDFLVRFEALAAGIGALLFVAIVVRTAQRDAGAPRRDAIRRISSNMLICGFPIVFFVLLFLGMSWWLTGVALAQYSSSYGNSALILGLGVSTVATQRVPLVDDQLLGLAPLLPVVLPAALVITLWRGRTLFLCVMCVLFPALLFDIEGLSTGGQFLLLRYLILAVPLVILSLVTLRHLRRVGFLLALAAVVVMTVSAWTVIGNKGLSGQEYAYHVAALGHPAAAVSDLDLSGATHMANWLDAQHLKAGSIMVDTFTGFEVLDETKYPQRFVTPAVVNFERYLQEPYQLGVRYMIVISPQGPGALYSLNRYFPGMYNQCISGTSLAFEIHISGTPQVARVFHLNRKITPNDLTYRHSCPVHRIILK